MSIRIAIVGGGKIATDQHIPALGADRAYDLVAIVDPVARFDAIPCYADLATALTATDLHAVAICTPPQIRFALACQALDAGKQVLLEKPPCATIGELLELQRRADAHRCTLYTAWHSQHASAVQSARAWLSARTHVSSVNIEWREDVRRWHPGQAWIWQLGGLGVFDPGINALSILTALLPGSIRVAAARFEVPSNGQMPSAAKIVGHIGEATNLEVNLDFFQTGPQTWNIDIIADDRRMTLSDGGATLVIDDEIQPIGASSEYPSLYARFAALIARGESEIDARPLQAVADAFAVAERIQVAPFVE